jgi:probable HAF family extracellular repeat protein
MKDTPPLRISRFVQATLAVACLSGCRNETGPAAPTIASVDVVAYTRDLLPNVDFPVFAVVKAPDGAIVSDQAITWTTSDVTIATVRATGPQTAMVKGTAIGTATISATANGHAGAVDIAITPVGPRPDVHAFLWTPDSGMADLGVLPGCTQSIARAINDLTQVVGSCLTVSGLRPFIWTASGGMTELSGFPAAGWANASGIDNSGQVVGSHSTPNGTRAFLWTATDGPIDLGTLPGAQNSYGRAINNNGTVIGQSGGRPFRWTAARGMEELVIPSTVTGALLIGINDQGQIVGQGSSGNDATQRAILWGTDGKATEVMCCFAYAASVNSVGNIAGMVGPGRHAFIWTPTSGITELGTLPGMSAGSADGINDQDQVIGTSRGGALDRAFLWSRASGMRDLGGLPGRASSFGFAVNNRGQVVGYAD